MKKLIVNVATGERVERDLTVDELAQLEIVRAEVEAREAEAEAREAARLSAIQKLEALGLTVDEVSAAFGLEA